MCFVCGLNNELGLQARFHELENGELLARFTPRKEHQGYPGRMHGGILGTILDETIGRAIMIRSKGAIWGVTVDFSMRLRKPVPIEGELLVIGRITRDSNRIFAGTGEVLLADNSVAVSGKGKYMKMPIEDIADFDHEKEQWRILPEETDPVTVDLPLK